MPTVVVFIAVFVVAGVAVGAAHAVADPGDLGAVRAADRGLACSSPPAQVYFRDLKNFLGYGLRMWLYASPILYFAARCPSATSWILMWLNPMAPLIRVERRDRSSGARAGRLVFAAGAAWAVSLCVAGLLFFISGSVSLLSVSSARDLGRGRLGHLPHVAGAGPTLRSTVLKLGRRQRIVREIDAVKKV